jgi:hypothetical protein
LNEADIEHAIYREDSVRPLQNTPFCPIPVVKIIAFLELEQKYLFFKGLSVNKKKQAC